MTLNKHATEVFSNRSIGPYKTLRSEGQNGRPSLQTIVANGFLRRYGDLHALACSTGRGSSDDHPLLWLPCYTTKHLIYDAYLSNWSEIMDLVYSLATSSSVRPQQVLSKEGFKNVRKCQVPTSHIPKNGSDFCDDGTQLQNIAEQLQNPNAIDAVIQARERHRQEALVELRRYHSVQSTAKQILPGDFIPLVFDFSEKILLPSLPRQPGQLDFLQG